MKVNGQLLKQTMVEGYFVTEDGRVFSNKKGMSKVDRDLHEIKFHLCKAGYKHVSLRFGKNGEEKKRFSVAHLVAHAFNGPRPEKKVIRHLDGNPLNNHFENLKYGSQLENILDKNKHGTLIRGGRHYKATITDKQAEEILFRISRGEKRTNLRKEFGVSSTVMYSLLKGKTFKNINRNLSNERKTK